MTVTKSGPRVKGQRCPICGGLAQQKFRPFCSSRCADLDLGAWLGGRYRIPSAEAPDGEDAAELARALSEDDGGDDDGDNDGGGKEWD